MKRIKHIALAAVAAVIVALTAAADQFPDDHADDHIGATPATFGAPLSGNVTNFIDRDFFTFTAQGETQYTVTVTPTTLDDASVILRASDGVGGVQEAHSVGGAQAVLEYVQPAGSFPCYVDVRGFADFTTGDYTIQFQQGAVTDSDEDGLPDVWEQQQFGTLTNGPGGDVDFDMSTNGDEYLAGTDATDAGSLLELTDLAVEGAAPRITWSSAPLRRYAVSAASGLSGDNWVPIGSATGTSASTSFTETGPPGAPRAYRVGLAP